MTDKTKKDVEKGSLGQSARDFLKEMREFALTVDEPCPEGHRRDPGSGRCLPIGSTDHTAFTRSLNDDQGDLWRGLEDKDNQTFDEQDDVAFGSTSEKGIDAEAMDERESCPAGTTFSFVQGKCVSIEEADAENHDELAMTEDAANGHEDVVAKDPAGRKDPVGFNCPPNMFFDFKRRKCIPLNKDTVLASVENKEDAMHGVARTSPDPLDGHTHFVTVDMEGNGMTSVSVGGLKESYPHSHEVAEFEVVPHEQEGSDYISRHPGGVNPMDPGDEGPMTSPFFGSDGNSEDDDALTTEERKNLPDDAFGVPEDRKFPLDTCSRVRNAMARFNQAKGLSDQDKRELKKNILRRASECDIKVDEFEDVGPDVSAGAEEAKKITTEQRKSLPDSAFGVPSKRKFPLDTCNRVRNAMARFNQAKGLSSGEKATLRRKILSAAKKCDIEVKDFAKAVSANEFEQVKQSLIAEARVRNTYSAKEEAAGKSGPCPPGMEWDPKTKKCMKAKGYVQSILASHQDIIAKDPEGRKDTEGFECPPGWAFDFSDRKCKPLDPANKQGFQPGDTTKAGSEDGAQRDLTPTPKGDVRLPQDCPKGTIWDGKRKTCVPLDPPDGADAAQDKSDCGPDEFFNPVTKKCMPKKGAFKKGKVKSKEEAVNAQPGNRDGLVGAPQGKVKHPTDCPPGTAWDGKRKVCVQMDTRESNRPAGTNTPVPPTDKAAEVENQVENMSLAKVISHLDQMIQEEVSSGRNKESAKVAARDLPNEAFPPSLVGATRRALMHHTPDVEDPYDTNTVDVSRLRNALARVSKVNGFSEKAIADAREHLLYHAREVIKDSLGKN